MPITKEILDIRICDVEPEANNTQTYREFIRESEEEFGIDPFDLDDMSDSELTAHLNFLDYLYTK